MKDENKWPFPSDKKQVGIPELTLVAISEDPREPELLTLFRSADERGKHCMLAMARAMPCMRGG